MYYVASTARSGDQFFAGEVEIFDFVSERAKRCIAANKEKRWRKNTIMGKFINYKWMLVLYSIGTMFLVIIHISHTQKWAGGFTEPSRYNAFTNGYN